MYYGFTFIGTALGQLGRTKVCYLGRCGFAHRAGGATHE